MQLVYKTALNTFEHKYKIILIPKFETCQKRYVIPMRSAHRELTMRESVEEIGSVTGHARLNCVAFGCLFFLG
jgi:hypothetical protein